MGAGTLALLSKGGRPPVPGGGPYLGELDKPISTLLSLGGLPRNLTLVRVPLGDCGNTTMFAYLLDKLLTVLGLGARRGAGYTAVATSIPEPASSPSRLIRSYRGPIILNYGISHQRHDHKR